MKDTLFINQENVPKLGKAYKRYVNHNGMLKEFKLGVLSASIISKKSVWFKLTDLPNYLQESLQDKALTREEIFEITNKKERKQEFVDKNDTRVYLTEDTEIIPIVGNFLPMDGVYAYTVVVINNIITLKPILNGCHWSDLFAGNTNYKDNVFCLATDLTVEQREYFKDEIIQLKEALDYLEQKNLVRKI